MTSSTGSACAEPAAADPRGALLPGALRQQGLGLTLAEIREIVAIRQGGRPPCGHVYQLLREKAAELDRKLQDLVLLRRRIRQSLAAWGRRPVKKAAVCPHIEAMEGGRRPRRATRA